MTIAIFIKLLATKMVASNFFGRSRSDVIIAMLFSCSSLGWLTSVFVRENNATSAPEIKAEQNKSKISMSILSKNDVLSDINAINRLLGSGSKIKGFIL